MTTYSLGIFTYSGSEHERLGHHIGIVSAAQRVDTVLSSIKKHTPPSTFRQIIVFDDNASDSEDGAAKVWAICEKHKIVYSRALKWGGTSAQVNRAMKIAECDWFVSLADDCVVLRHWWDHSKYFIENNDFIPFKMLAFPVVYAHRLEYHGLMKRIEFYDRQMDEINPYKVNAFVEAGPVTCPSFTAHGSGVGVIYHRETYEKLGGAWETNFAPEEIMGFLVWTQTDGVVIQLPTSPLLHYENGSSWGDHVTSPVYWRQAENIEEELIHRFNLNRPQAQCLQIKRMQEKAASFGDLARICKFNPIKMYWWYWPKQTFSGFEDLLGGGQMYEERKFNPPQFNVITDRPILEYPPNSSVGPRD